MGWLRRGRRVLHLGGNVVVLHVRLRVPVQLLLLLLLLLVILRRHGGRLLLLLLLPGPPPAHGGLRRLQGPLLLRNSRGRLGRQQERVLQAIAGRRSGVVVGGCAV